MSAAKVNKLKKKTSNANIKIANPDLREIFLDFQTTITKEIKKSYKIFNPDFGIIPIITNARPDQRAMLKTSFNFNYGHFEEASKAAEHFPAMGVLTNVAVFEAYLPQLFRLTFDLVTKDKATNKYKPMGDIEKACKPLASAFLKKYLGDKKSESLCQSIYEFMKNENAQSSPKHPLEGLLEDFYANKIEPCLSQPLLGNAKKDHILKAFSMFCGENSVKRIETVLKDDKLEGFYLQHTNPALKKPDQLIRYQVKFRNIYGLEMLLNLFYGLRCCFAHGITDSTVKTGVLSGDIDTTKMAMDVVAKAITNSTTDEREIIIMTDKKQKEEGVQLCQEYIKTTWNTAKADKNGMKIDYDLYLNSLNAYMYIARILTVVSDGIVKG